MAASITITPGSVTKHRNACAQRKPFLPCPLHHRDRCGPHRARPAPGEARRQPTQGAQRRAGLGLHVRLLYCTVRTYHTVAAPLHMQQMLSTLLSVPFCTALCCRSVLKRAIRTLSISLDEMDLLHLPGVLCVCVCVTEHLLQLCARERPAFTVLSLHVTGLHVWARRCQGALPACKQTVTWAFPTRRR